MIISPSGGENIPDPALRVREGNPDGAESAETVVSAPGEACYIMPAIPSRNEAIT